MEDGLDLGRVEDEDAKTSSSGRILQSKMKGVKGVRGVMVMREGRNEGDELNCGGLTRLIPQSHDGDYSIVLQLTHIELKKVL
jgi:hypothetical protein